MITNLPKRRGCMFIHYRAQRVTKWFAFSADKSSETLESSTNNDELSMHAMFLTVLCMVEGLEAKMISRLICVNGLIQQSERSDFL